MQKAATYLFNRYLLAGRGNYQFMQLNRMHQLHITHAQCNDIFGQGYVYAVSVMIISYLAMDFYMLEEDNVITP